MYDSKASGKVTGDSIHTMAGVSAVVSLISLGRSVWKRKVYVCRRKSHCLSRQGIKSDGS